MIVVDTRKTDARIGVSGETKQQTGDGKMTKQQKELIEKLKAGYRIFSTSSGIEIIGTNGSYQTLGNVAKANMYKLATRDVVDAVYSNHTMKAEFRLNTPVNRIATSVVNPCEVALLDRILSAI